YEGPLRDSLPDFLAQGLRWDLPKLTYGLDLDYALTNAMAVTAGVSASLGQHRQFVSYHGGIGLFSAGPSTGFRLDVGVQVADIHYAGATVAFRSVDSVPDD